jgi:hypothetical protein
MQEHTPMVPLMMQQDYQPKGWLGLILGGRLWHAFFESAVDTDDKFMRAMDALVREIGPRGKIKTKVSEGVPPQAAAAPAPAPATIFEPTPEPAPAPVPAPAPAPALPPAALSTPSRSVVATLTATERQRFSPSVQQQQVQEASPVTPTMVPSIESVGLVQRLLDERKEMEAKMEARLDAKDAKMEQQRKDMEAKLERLTVSPPAAITEADLASLQTRIEALRIAKLITVRRKTKCLSSSPF